MKGIEEKNRILIDSREFLTGTFTGIARVLEGLIDTLGECSAVHEITCTVIGGESIPDLVGNCKKVRLKKVSAKFFRSEWQISRLSGQGYSLFISPYPKLPLFGCRCSAIHIIHDVLDLTHDAYRNRTKAKLDKFRLSNALNKASLTWYDSQWSMNETRSLVGKVGKNPKVRYLGIDSRFESIPSDRDPLCLKKYGLSPGYILSIGNGLPHKNIGVLLDIADHLVREIVFVGVKQKNLIYWQQRFGTGRARWIAFVEEENLPAVIRGAFCLAQPSLAEGYGYPPLEAMACGVPAVVSDIPVLAETTGSRALLAKPDDAVHWLERFQSLENKNTYQRLVDDGLEWARQFQGDAAWKGHLSDVMTLLGDR